MKRHANSPLVHPALSHSPGETISIHTCASVSPALGCRLCFISHPTGVQAVGVLLHLDFPFKRVGTSAFPRHKIRVSVWRGSALLCGNIQMINVRVEALEPQMGLGVNPSSWVTLGTSHNPSDPLGAHVQNEVRDTFLPELS